MKTTTLLALLVLGVCVLTPRSANAQKKIVEINAATDVTLGERVRGPAEIRITNLNILRYDIQIGRTVTFPAGPDLTLPFIPPIPSEASEPGAEGLTAPTGTIPALFAALADDLRNIDDERVEDVQNPILTAINAVNTARADLEALVMASDSMLITGGGPAAIIAGTRLLIEPAGASVIDNALRQTWPDTQIESLLLRLDNLELRLVALPTVTVTSGPDWATWYGNPANRTLYDTVVARINELQANLTALRSATNSQAIAMRNAQNKLRQWRPILVGIVAAGPAAFSRTFDVGCGFAFSNNRETKIEIVKRDRMADPGTAATRQEVVTVVCSAPLSISGGFGFSGVDEREFVFVPSTKTVTENGQTSEVVINRFGFRNSSSFRTLPVLLLNTRVYERSDLFSVHLSAGAAVDVKTGEGGTDLEYIVGPSFAFRRTLFITPGVHIGRVPTLAGGFRLDQEVPEGVSEPPIEKAWRTGFVVTFTYKIR